MGYSVKGKQGFQAKHGLSNHPLYGTWKRMKNRCYNVRSKDFNDYGGRGITVCESWRSEFLSFYQWAINNGWEKGLSIERIDYNEGYSPDNCTWIPMSDQSKNRRMTPDCNTCRWFIPIPMRILTKAEAEMVRNGIYIERRQCIWNVCRYENKEKNHDRTNENLSQDA